MAFAPPQHRPIGVQTWAERKADYVATRKQTAYGRRWRKLRAAYLVQHPLCECGCNRPAEVVHHKRAHRDDEALMYDWDNLQALTKRCHDAITARHDGGFGNKHR